MDKQTWSKDIKTFEWEELDGKTLKIRAGKQEGVLIVAGYDQETKDIFVLHDEKVSDPIPLPTIKPGDKVRHKEYPASKGIVEEVFISAQVNFDDARTDYRLIDLEVISDEKV